MFVSRVYLRSRTGIGSVDLVNLSAAHGLRILHEFLTEDHHIQCFFDGSGGSVGTKDLLPCALSRNGRLASNTWCLRVIDTFSVPGTVSPTENECA